MDMFEKWNNNVDLAGLQQDIKDAQDGDMEFKKVPYGEYEVKVEKMELKATGENSKAPGSPMVSIMFTIISGKYKNQKIFMNQVILKGYPIHIMNTFLKSMDTGIDVEFVDYIQYANLLLDIAEECDTNKLEFALKYEDNKGYDKFTITEVFEG